MITKKISEKMANGTLDESDLKRVIIRSSHSLQEDFQFLKDLTEVDMFKLLFGAAAQFLGYDEAVSRLFRKNEQTLAPTDHVPHLMVIAAYLGKSEVVRSLLLQGADPDDPSFHFGLALPAAAKRGHDGIVKLLLENGADINGPSCVHSPYRNKQYASTALAAASKGGHENVMRLLLQPEYNLPTSGRAFEMALIHLVENCQAGLVLLLLDRGTFADRKNLHQEIFMAACKNGCLALAQVMFEKGVDVNEAEVGESRALEMAAHAGHDSTVTFLLKVGADQKLCPYWDDAITAAAKRGHLGTIKILLEHGAEIDSPLGRYSSTPLYEAAKHNRVDMVRFLLSRGASLVVSQFDYDLDVGYEAMEHAVTMGREGIVRALAEGGVNVNAIAAEWVDHDPPLIVTAMMWGQDEMVELLLELGAEMVDPLETKWGDDFRKGVYPKSAWTLRSRRTA